MSQLILIIQMLCRKIISINYTIFSACQINDIVLIIRPHQLILLIMISIMIKTKCYLIKNKYNY